jgi:hypothetical protein
MPNQDRSPRTSRVRFGRRAGRTLLADIPLCHLAFMRTDLDTYTLVGDPIARATHALEVARHQIRAAQSASSARLESALMDAEDAINEQLGRIRNAITNEADDTEASGETDRQRWEWYPATEPRDWDQLGKKSPLAKVAVF